MRPSLLVLLLLSSCLLRPATAGAGEGVLDAAGAPAALETVATDAAGRRHGPYLEHHANGEVAVRAAYREGLLHGTYRTYGENGRLLAQATYRKGVLHGPWKDYHGNRRLKLSATYRDGALHGAYVLRDADGATRIKTTYVRGVLHGTFRAFEGKRAVSRQTWRHGVPLDVDGVQPFGRAPETMASEVQRLLAGDGELDADPLAADRELALRYLKAYRCISGVPYEDLRRDPAHEAYAQAAAEICRTLGHITHVPENPGWEGDRFRFAATGTKSSNLAQGLIACRSVRGYMDDSDARNIAKVGHRAWCLNPRMQATGFGSVDTFSAMWSIDGARKDVPDYDIVASPPPGYAPGPWYGPHWAWHVSMNPKHCDAPRAGAVNVEVVPVGATFLPTAAPLALDHLSVLTKSAGVPYMVVFRPVGFSLDAGTRYRVSLEGLTHKGKPRPLRYYVEFFDLAYPAPKIPSPTTRQE